MNSELTFEDYQQLAAVYDLLSNLWLEEIDLELLNALASIELKTAIKTLGGTIPDKIDEDTVDELAVDYCQLLIGPKNCVSPIQSDWQNQTLAAETAASIKKYFELLPGFEPRSNLSDHIGVQMQFMGELFQRAADAEDKKLVDAIADQFFQEHLSWTAPFLAEVGTRAKTEFYAGLANLTANFLNLEPSEY